MKTDSEQIRPSYISFSKFTVFLLVILATPAFLALSPDYFLVFHAVSELAFVVISFGIFIIAWNVRNTTDDSYVFFLGSAFLMAGCFNFLHALTFEGMNLFKKTDTLDISFHLESSAIIIKSVSFFLAPFFLTRKYNFKIILICFFFVGLSLLFFAAKSGQFPICHNECGATPFRKGLDAGAALLFIGSIIHHYYRRKLLDKTFYKMLLAGILFSIPAGPIEIFHPHSADFTHFLWYSTNLISYGFIYKGVILVGLIQPQTILFRDLQESRNALRAERDRAQRYLDIAGVILIAVDREGRVSMINKKGCQLKGCTETEIIGKDYIDTFVPDRYKKEVRASFKKQITGEMPLIKHSVLPINAADGQELLVEWNHSLLTNSAGEIVGTLSSGEDITEKATHLQTIEQAKKDWEMTFDAVPDLISIIDRNYRIVRVNKAMAARMNMLPDEARGTMCYEFLKASCDPYSNCPHCKTIADGQNHSLELNEESMGGHFIVTTVPLFDADGKIYASVHVAHDVTELKEREKELKEMHGELEKRVEERSRELMIANMGLQEEIIVRQQAEEDLLQREKQFKNLSQEFNALLDAIPDILILIEPDGKIRWANRGATSFFCVELNEVLDRPYIEFFKTNLEDDHAKELAIVRESFLAGRECDARMLLECGRTLAVRTFPIKNDVGTVINVILVGTNITEQLTLEAETLRTRHLSSLGELAAGVAHEINNPINGIINYAQLIVNKTDKVSREHEIAKRIIHEGDRVAHIVRSLLSFSKGRAIGERKMTAVGDILADVLTLTLTQIQKDGIRLKVDIPDDLPQVFVNPHQIAQVFLNLISNSRFALNEKYANGHDSKLLEIVAKEKKVDDGLKVQITVTDHGSGIAEKTLSKVTDPFFSTKPGDKGTGLGLSISHSIIADHRGLLTIQSKPGEFTAISFDLPVGDTKNG